MALFGTWLAALRVLCIYSFLYKDNPLYKFAEHVYVGILAGYFVAAEYHNVVLSNLVNPLYTDFPHKLYLLIPGLLGLLAFFAFSRKLNWLVRFPLSFVVGIGAGPTVMAQLSADVMAQVQATAIPLNSLNNVLFVAGVLTTLVCFFFSVEHRGFLGGTAQVGGVVPDGGLRGGFRLHGDGPDPPADRSDAVPDGQLAAHSQAIPQYR